MIQKDRSIAGGGKHDKEWDRTILGVTCDVLFVYKSRNENIHKYDTVSRKNGPIIIKYENTYSLLTGARLLSVGTTFVYPLGPLFLFPRII